jgi:hypothetical protein
MGAIHFEMIRLLTLSTDYGSYRAGNVGMMARSLSFGLAHLVRAAGRLF